MGKNSILEQALLQMNMIEEAVQRNSEVILASTMKQELNGMLKEEEEEDKKFPGSEEEDETGINPEETAAEPDGDENGGFDDHDEDNESGEFGGEEPSLEGEPEGEDLMGDEGMGDESLEDTDDDETLDMTGASDGEVLKVFRAMKPEDGIVVKKDGDKIEITVDDQDYIIKLTEQEEKEAGTNDSEQVYEIELDEFEDDFGDDFGGSFDSDEDDDDLSQWGLDNNAGTEDFGTEGELGNDDEEAYRDDNDVFGSNEDSFGTEGELGEAVAGEDPFDKSVNSNRNQKAALGGKPALGKAGGSVGDKDPFDKGVNTSRNQKASLGGKPALGKTGGSVGDTDPFDKSVSGERKEIKEVDGSAPFDKKVGKAPVKTEVGEAARTKLNPHGDKNDQNRLGIKGKKVYQAGSGANLSEQVETLKKQNAEYKKALLLFKDKLNEVAVFNANLAHAVRIITEQSTTKAEKLDILKRFDSVSTITESKKLYGQIKTELDTKKPVVETVTEKITSASKTTGSSEVLSESKSYENPQFKRMLELMTKIK